MSDHNIAATCDAIQSLIRGLPIRVAIPALIECLAHAVATTNSDLERVIGALRTATRHHTN